MSYFIFSFLIVISSFFIENNIKGNSSLDDSSQLEDFFESELNKLSDTIESKPESNPSLDNLLVSKSLMNNLLKYASSAIKSKPYRETNTLIVIKTKIKTFEIKQISDQGHPSYQFCLISDLISSYCAEKIDFGYQAIDIVRLIPQKEYSPLKFLQNHGATVHTKMAGISLEEYKKKPLHEQKPFFNTISLSLHCIMDYRCDVCHGEPDLEEVKKMLTTMTLHKDLPGIMAFDTFVGHRNREDTTVFFDETTNHFYGVDHSNAFCDRLALTMLLYLMYLKYEGYFIQAPQSIYIALEQYKNILQKLYIACPPVMIETLYDTYLPFIETPDFEKKCFSMDINRLRKGIKKNIKENYEAIPRLINFIEALSKQYKK